MTRMKKKNTENLIKSKSETRIAELNVHDRHIQDY